MEIIIYSLGKAFLLFGIGSFLLHLGNREFALLMWVDNWGVAIGNTIRGSMILIGLIFFYLSSRKPAGEPVENFNTIKAKGE